MLNKFKVLLKRKSVKNGVWLYLLQFFNTVIPLITVPYITRVLGPSQYGMFSIALNIIGYLQVVVEYGFGMSATRKVAVSNDKKNEIDELFSPVILSRTLLSLGCFCFVIFFSIISKFSNLQNICLFILFISLIGFCVQMNWAFQGAQEMKYIAIMNILARSICTILVFVLVHDQRDLLLYCFLYAFSPVLSGVFGLYFAKKRFGIKLKKISFMRIFDELKSGWFVFTTSLSSKVFSAIGITFLAFFATSEEVGVFSAIQKIPNAIILVWSPVSQVLYPISSERWAKSEEQGEKFVNKVRRIFMLPFLCLCLLLGFFAEPIVNFAFGEDYRNSFYLLYPLLLWVAVSIFNNFTGVQTLLASGNDKKYSVAFQISVIITIFTNLLFTYLWRGIGAAWAPLISESILGILLIFEIKKAKRKALKI